MANRKPQSDQKQSASVQPSGKVEPAPLGQPAHAHEGTDVAIMPLVFSLIAFVVLAVFVLGLSYAIFRATESVQVGSQEKQSGLTVPVQGPQEPRIQGIPGFHDNNPSQDMSEFRTRNEVLLSNYVAAEEGRPARIPVDRSMTLALQNNLFKVAAPAASQPSPDTHADKSAGVPIEPSGPKSAAPTDGAKSQ